MVPQSPEYGEANGLAPQAAAATEAHDEWSRVGDYLDRLAFENDRLEAELRIKRARRLEREIHQSAVPAATSVDAKPTVFDEIAETNRYEARSASETTQNMHLSYDALRRDLGGLMSELNEFKSSRAKIMDPMYSR